VPVSLEQLVADAAACSVAGAGSVHVHPRRPADAIESLAAESHDAVVAAIRAACPRLEISCSTQEDIDLGTAPDRIAAVRAWTAPPDVVSLNLAEGGARVDVRVGLEDTLIGRDGKPAPGNAAQVAATLR
jgi:uncharacterized protein (DUF849 family)